MAYMRSVSLGVLGSSFASGQRILELGCGTGEEAIALGRQGVCVWATDVSSQMVRITSEKAAAAGLPQGLHARQLAAGQIGVLVDELGEGAFDGAYASFGVLNGEPDLHLVGRALTRLIRPGGLLVTSVMNRFYPVEVAWYLAHVRPSQAVRRWRGVTMAHVSPELSVRVPTWYYTPRTFARAFPAFRQVHCRALTLLLPPPFAAHVWHRFPGLTRRLALWEERLAGRWPFAALGDHFLVVLERM